MADLGLIFIILGVILESVTAFYIFFFLCQQRQRKNLTILLALAFSFLAWGLGVFFILWGILVPFITGPDVALSNVLFSTGILLLALMVLFFLIFMIYVEYGTGRQFLFHLLFSGALLGTFIGLILSPSILSVKYLPSPAIIFVSMQKPALITGGITVLYLTCLFTVVFGRIWRENRGLPLERKFRYLTVGLLVHFISFFLLQLWGSVANSNVIGLFCTYPGTIGLLLFTKGLKLFPQYLIYLKEKVNRLIVFRQGGEVLYIYRFRPFSAVEEMYITSALVGVSDFLQNTLGLEKNEWFRTIDVITHKIMCEFEGGLGFALVATKESPILREALKNVIHQFLSRNLFKRENTIQSSDFLEQILPTLNAIVEDVFFFYPKTTTNEEV